MCTAGLSVWVSVFMRVDAEIISCWEDYSHDPTTKESTEQQIYFVNNFTAVSFVSTLVLLHFIWILGVGFGVD